MFSSITLNDAAGAPVDIHADSGKRRVYRAVGLSGIQPPRPVTRLRPTGHGAINGTRWTEGRLIVLEGRIQGALDAADAFSEFRTLTTPMLETLDVGEALLKWTERNGLSLQAYVKLYGEVEPPAEVGPDVLVYQAQFLAEDPRAYSQSQSTSVGGVLSVSSGGLVFPVDMPFTFLASAGATAAANNIGNRPTPPIFRVYGMAVNPHVLLVGGTGRIALKGTIGAGDYLEIDVQNRTITLNGTSPALQYLDAAQTTWFELPRGTSTVQLLAGNFDAVARVDVLWRSAYT